MGLFSNNDHLERRLADYRIELGHFKNCLNKYEDLAKGFEAKLYEHSNQIKGYDDNLQRYENQLELYTEKYDNIIKDYDAILKESTLNMVAKQEDILHSLECSRQKNKGLTIMMRLSIFLHLATISGFAVIIFYLL